MTEHSGALRPAWQWYALAGVLLLVLLGLDLVGLLDVLGPDGP